MNLNCLRQCFIQIFIHQAGLLAKLDFLLSCDVVKKTVRNPFGFRFQIWMLWFLVRVLSRKCFRFIWASCLLHDSRVRVLVPGIVYGGTMLSVLMFWLFWEFQLDELLNIQFLIKYFFAYLNLSSYSVSTCKCVFIYLSDTRFISVSEI